MPYFAGQGKLYVANVTAGVPGAFRWVGNVPELNVNFKTDVVNHKESFSGQQLTDLRLERSKDVEFVAALEDFTKENIALATRSARTVLGTTPVVDELSPTGLVAGDFFKTQFPRISAVVITDNLSAALVLGTHYEITSADHGTIKLLNVTGFTQPFKTDYSHLAADNIPFFTAARASLWFKFDGLNVASDTGTFSPVLVEMYKCSPDPLEQLLLIAEDVTQFTLKGSAQYDSLKANDATLGQFGRMVHLY